MSEKKESIYIKGFNIKALKPETPDSVKAWKKAEMGVHIDTAIAHLESMRVHASDTGLINYDLTKNIRKDSGESFLSFKFNDYKPEVKDQPVQGEDVPW